MTTETLLDDATPAAPAAPAREAPAARTTAAPASREAPAAPAAPAAREAPADRGTFFEDDDSPEPAETEAKEATTDWRERRAYGDPKKLNELKRYASEELYDKATWALRQKLSSGEYTRKPPENASDEEKAKWREEIGVPKDHTGYNIPEIRGHEWTEADEPILESFLAQMHEANTPQDQVQQALHWYGQFVNQQKQVMHQTDLQDKQNAEDHLRGEWDNNYRRNLNMTRDYLKDPDVFPEGFAQKLNQARTPDGKRLMNDPFFANYLFQHAYEHIGEGGMVYGDAKVSVNSRKEEIEKILTTNPRRYWSEGLDKELRDINLKLEAANQPRKRR